jgi:hypothetical protein
MDHRFEELLLLHAQENEKDKREKDRRAGKQSASRR